MVETVSCPGCQTKLKMKPEYAGKKIKCPRCAQMILVPDARGVTAAPPKVAAAKKATPKGRAAPREEEDEAAVMTSPRKKKGRQSDMSPCPECGEMVDNDARKCPHCRTPLEVDDEEEYKKWKKCPECGQKRARRVLWTFWGSFYFTAIFKHVRCEECGTTYNGKTGKSNLGPAVICVSVPLLAIAAIGHVILWIIRDRGADPAEWLTYLVWGMDGVAGLGVLAGVILWLVKKQRKD